LLWTDFYIAGHLVDYLPLYEENAESNGISSLFVQIGGASMASGSNISNKQMLLGIHIYMGGIGIQQIFIFLFLALAICFQLGLKEVLPSHHLTQAKRLLYVIYTVLLLITICIIFRPIEYSNGLKSTNPLQRGVHVRSRLNANVSCLRASKHYAPWPYHAWQGKRPT
jgi:hypothetical protein